jgi:hypothetical protein
MRTEIHSSKPLISTDSSPDEVTLRKLKMYIYITSIAFTEYCQKIELQAFLENSMLQFNILVEDVSFSLTHC